MPIEFVSLAGVNLLMDVGQVIYGRKGPFVERNVADRENITVLLQNNPGSPAFVFTYLVPRPRGQWQQSFAVQWRVHWGRSARGFWPFSKLARCPFETRIRRQASHIWARQKRRCSWCGGQGGGCLRPGNDILIRIYWRSLIVSMHAACICVDMTIAGHFLGKAEVETLVMTAEAEKPKQTHRLIVASSRGSGVSGSHSIESITFASLQLVYRASGCQVRQNARPECRALRANS